jgi:hypothetical protein
MRIEHRLGSSARQQGQQSQGRDALVQNEGCSDLANDGQRGHTQYHGPG